MNNLKNMTAADERDMALSTLNGNLIALSKTYKECFLAMGKGGLLVYTQDILHGKIPGKHHYRTKQELLVLFDQPVSHNQLGNLIDHYDPKREGIMVLITSHANATYFVTCKL